ncbi:MAG: hypothetical protein IPH12_07850 [Saprospirales bacterium]|nr:hypothetical protein [Saprospirales bacterium]
MGNFLEACAGDSVQAALPTDIFLDGNDTAAYMLHTGAGALLGQVLAQNIDGVFQQIPGMQADSIYYISYVAGNAVNGLPDLSDPCLAVSPGQPVVFHSYPAVLAGMDTAICGNSAALQAHPPAGYWSVLTGPAAALALAGIQNPGAVVTAAQPGAYALSWTASSNGCTAADSLKIVFWSNPIPEDLKLACDSTNESYTVRFKIDGGAPPYFIDGELLAGDTFTSDPLPAGTSYVFLVWDNNQCAADTLTGNHACACTTSAGTLPAALLSACAGDSVRVVSNGDYVLDGNDVAAFVLHSSPGPALGQPFAYNQTGVFGFTQGMQYGVTYYVSLVAGNAVNGFPNPTDACLSVSAGQPVIFLPPLTPVAAGPAALCGLQATLSVAGAGYPGKWTLDAGPGPAVFSDAVLPNSSVEVSIPGMYVFRWTTSNGLCTATDTAAVVFNAIPSVENLKNICAGTNDAYTVSFTVSGGLPPYTADGLNGGFNVNTFLSEILPNNSFYSFFITDANGCTSPPQTGTHNCLCASNAGSMLQTTATFCAGQPAIAVWNNDPVLDADDTLLFVLHNLPGNTLGTIFGTADKPAFPLAPGMQTGTTYYISAVAGNKASGSINLNDPCLSVAAGAPVQWRALPAAAMNGDQSICAGQSVMISLTGSGVFPLEARYQDDAGTVYTAYLTAPVVEIAVMPTLTTTYTLLSVQDSGTPACRNEAVPDSIRITVRNPASAGVPTVPLEACAQDTVQVVLADMLAGENTGGFWVEQSPAPSATGGFDAAAGIFRMAEQLPGEYIFQYTVKGEPPCPDDSAHVAVFIRPRPVANAGPDKTLDCDHPEVLIGQILQPAGHLFEWRREGVAVPGGQAPAIWAEEPGLYVLAVINDFGCTAVDTAQVFQSGKAFSGWSLQVHPVRCHGEANGIIRIDSVYGGSPPVLFGLNGGLLSQARNFEGLPPGVYILDAQDAAGCMWRDTVIIAEPPEIKIDLGGDIEAALGDSAHLVLYASINPGSLDTVIWAPCSIRPQQAGCFSILLRCAPAELQQRCAIPTGAKPLMPLQCG